MTGGPEVCTERGIQHVLREASSKDGGKGGQPSEDGGASSQSVQLRLTSHHAIAVQLRLTRPHYSRAGISSAHTRPWPHTYTHTLLHTCAQPRTATHTHSHTQFHLRAHTDTRTDAHTHTHTHTALTSDEKRTVRLDLLAERTMGLASVAPPGGGGDGRDGNAAQRPWPPSLESPPSCSLSRPCPAASFGDEPSCQDTLVYSGAAGDPPAVPAAAVPGTLSHLRSLVCWPDVGPETGPDTGRGANTTAGPDPGGARWDVGW